MTLTKTRLVPDTLTATHVATATVPLTETTTATQSLSLEVDPALPASAVPEGITRTAQVTSGITVAAAALGGAAAAGPALSLAILTMMSCSPAEQKSSNSATQYLVAPLIDLGRDVAAAGNAGIVACVVALHWAASRAAGAERVRFPGLSVTVAALLCGGTLALSFGVMAAGRDGERWWVGALLVALIVALLAAHRWYLWRRLLPRLSYVLRKPQSSRVMGVLLPIGDWMPLSLRQQYSPFVNPVAGAALARHWSLWNVLHTLVYSLMAAFAPGSAGGCVAQLSVMAAWCWALAVVVACVRPHRVPLTDGFACGGLVLTATAVTLTAAYQGVAASGGEVAGLLTALVVVTMLQVVLTVVKVLHSVWLQWMERQRRQNEEALNGGADDEELLASSGHGSDLGELLVVPPSREVHYSRQPPSSAKPRDEAALSRHRESLVASLEPRKTVANTIRTLTEIRATVVRRQTWRRLRNALPTDAEQAHDDVIDRELLEALVQLASVPIQS